MRWILHNVLNFGMLNILTVDISMMKKAVPLNPVCEDCIFHPFSTNLTCSIFSLTNMYKCCPFIKSTTVYILPTIHLQVQFERGFRLVRAYGTSVWTHNNQKTSSRHRVANTCWNKCLLYYLKGTPRWLWWWSMHSLISLHIANNISFHQSKEVKHFLSKFFLESR